MNDDELRKILQNKDLPEPDSERRKEALNMAMSEYDSSQKEKNQKKSQGSGFLSRLLGTSNKDRRQKMDKKYIYGGMATALGVILAAGIMFQQGHIPFGDSAPKQTLSEAAALRNVDFGVTGDSSYKSSAGSSSPGVAQKAPVVAEQSAPLAQKPAKSQQPAARSSSDSSALSAVDFNVNGSSIAQQDLAPIYFNDQGRDKFEDFEENPVKLVSEEPVSTFSADVDTTSYSFMRQRLNSGVLPQKDSIRVEELINYFDYDYPLPETRARPFKPSVMVTPSPWADGKKLMHIGIKGYDIDPAEKPNSNLVFLLDVSGSMAASKKLPLLKNSFKLLLDQLGENDTVSIVVYAGAAGTVLEPTKASEKNKIISALENLGAGGSTAGGEGIRQAYNLAEQNFDKDAINRVILATDGDFNVGIRDHNELQDFVERKREKGIFLSVLGFGQGNYNDQMMQALAQNGNGVAAYIDSLNEAQKVLVDEASSTLFPIAKDVKLQVEFNPNAVSEYRLIGYETRALNREDFKNDKVDAGDIGAGHTVTAIYEITPTGSDARLIEPTRYEQDSQSDAQKADTDFGDEYAFLKIRYKLPDEDTSKLITTPVRRDSEINDLRDTTNPLAREFKFATAVAGFGQLLKGGKFLSEDFTYDDVLRLAQESKGEDMFGYRAEFIQLARLAKYARAMPARRR